jgi:hypothetical protein
MLYEYLGGGSFYSHVIVGQGFHALLQGWQGQKNLRTGKNHAKNQGKLSSTFLALRNKNP